MSVVAPIALIPPLSTGEPRNRDRRLLANSSQASKAENTLRSYRSDWQHFCAWCTACNACPLPGAPDAVAADIADCAGRLKVGSIQQRLTAIAAAHEAEGFESPTHSPMVRNAMKGIRRTLGTAQVQKTPASTDDIRSMLAAADTGLIGARDRALILLGFAGAFRRSELIAIDVPDCTFGCDGITVTLLRRSETDRRKIGISYGADSDACPVRATQSWMKRANIAAGPVFRSINRHGQVQARRLSGIDVARIVKKLAKRAGLDAANYAGQSLRSGYTANMAGPGCLTLREDQHCGVD